MKKFRKAATAILVATALTFALQAPAIAATVTQSPAGAPGITDTVSTYDYTGNDIVVASMSSTVYCTFISIIATLQVGTTVQQNYSNYAIGYGNAVSCSASGARSGGGIFRTISQNYGQVTDTITGVSFD